MWIRVNATDDSEGLWDVERRCLIDPASLPISDRLRAQLTQWIERYWYERPAWQTLDLEAFSADGREIAKSLKAELPSVIINYYDAADARNQDDDFPRADHPDPWDYEIL